MALPFSTFFNLVPRNRPYDIGVQCVISIGGRRQEGTFMATLYHHLYQLELVRTRPEIRRTKIFSRDLGTAGLGSWGHDWFYHTFFYF